MKQINSSIQLEIAGRDINALFILLKPALVQSKNPLEKSVTANQLGLYH